MDDFLINDKIISKIVSFAGVFHLKGDIMHFGVVDENSVALWLRLLKLYEFEESCESTQVLGFDFFEKRGMCEIFANCNKILPRRLRLVKGDAVKKSLEHVTEKIEEGGEPGIKLLCIEFSNASTTMVLSNLWDLVVKNGVVILDISHKLSLTKFLAALPVNEKCEITEVSQVLVIRKIY